MTRERHPMRRRQFISASAAALGGAAVASPASAHGDVEHADVTVKSYDGTSIAATVSEPPADDRHPDGHPAVLTTHGYGGTRADLSGRATRYARNDYVALAYDSRGFGESEGTSGFDGPEEVRDATVTVPVDSEIDEPLEPAPRLDDAPTGKSGDSTPAN